MTILLTKKQVAARVGLHAEHVMRMAREGRFPKPVKLGPQPGCAVRFVQEEVEAWLRDRMAERNHASA